jgi:hypothetical protein
MLNLFLSAGIMYCLSEWRTESTYKQKSPSAQVHICPNTQDRKIGWLSVLYFFFSFLAFYLILPFLVFHSLYKV